MRLILWLSIILIFAHVLVDAGKKKNKKSEEESVEHSSEENSSEEIRSRNKTVTSTASSATEINRHPVVRRTTPLRKSARTSSQPHGNTRFPKSVVENVPSTASAISSPEAATHVRTTKQNDPETSTEPTIVDFTNDSTSEDNLAESTDWATRELRITVVASNSEQNGPAETSTEPPIANFTAEVVNAEVPIASTDSGQLLASTFASLTSLSVQNPTEQAFYNFSSLLATRADPITTGTPFNKTMNRGNVDSAADSSNDNISEIEIESFTHNTFDISDVEFHSVYGNDFEVLENSTLADDHGAWNSTSLKKSETEQDGGHGQTNETATVEEIFTERPEPIGEEESALINTTTKTFIVSDLSTISTSIPQSSEFSISETQRTTGATEENESFAQSTSKISDVEFVSFKKDVTEILENSTFSDNLEAWNATQRRRSVTVPEEESSSQANETVMVEAIYSQSPEKIDEESATSIDSRTETSIAFPSSTSLPPTFAYSVSETQRNTGSTGSTGSPTQKGILQQKKKSGFFLFLPF